MKFAINNTITNSSKIISSYTILAIFIFPFYIFSQQKGATPISKIQINENQSKNTYAVVVGISDYQDLGIPDLRFADKDAEAFANYLKSKAGGNLDADHLKVLLNEKATVAQFAMALDWLMEVVKENDQVILYFSGHGDVEKKTITQPGYLLCWDAPARVYLAGGALALPMFQDIITTLSAQKKLKWSS
ncbi:MAG: caspase family protein [Saprospiraceae bacterium]|nr:caspase family protein [Candidatus Vicinibacter affinis]